ncbi:MAG: hypothetical protein RJB57_842, partial [Actinomycetota bacterium]
MATVAVVSVPQGATATDSPSRVVRANEICGDYLGRVVCVPVTRPEPKAPSTTSGMKATANPATVPFSSSVTVTSGAAPGGRGYTKGELVRLYEFWEGDATELTGTKFASATGSITFSRQYLSLAGADKDGERILCARGEKSGRMACVKVWVGARSGSDTTAPAAGTPGGTSGTKTPSKASTTRGMKSSGTKKKIPAGGSVKVTNGPASGAKGFTKGEKVVHVVYHGGRSTEVGSSTAGSSGRVSFTWTNDGDAQGTHELCSYGVKSKKMACYTVEADGVATTAPPVTSPPATTPPAT